MSPLLRDHEKSPALKALPKAGMSDAALAASAASALNFDMQSWDGASYIKIKKCVVTSSKWDQLEAGGERSGRYVKTACGLDLLGGKCAVIYSGCRQPYLGNEKYGPCENSAMAVQDANPIPCGKI
jgi:hypothetical protein